MKLFSCMDKIEVPMASVLPENTSIVIVAANASDSFGGEAILPLHYFRVLRARGRRVVLLTHARSRPSLSSIFGPDCANILYVPDTAWHRAIWRMGKPFPAQIRVNVFDMALRLLDERMQARMIRKLVAEGRTDLIHQPTPVSPKAPSSIYGLGVPVVIGPMNGGMSYPPGYEDFQTGLDRWFTPAARLLSGLANGLLPGKRRAAVLLVSNDRTRRALPVRHPNVIKMPENGVDLDTFKTGARRAPSPAGTLRLVFMGRLVSWKAVDVTLRALADARRRGVIATLDILGDGEERARLEILTAELGLVDAVTFHGFLAQGACVDHLRRADALILNSLYECGGAVVLEAMSQGLPVIASDWGGPRDYIDETTGILVAPSPREGFAARLADAMCRLAADPDLRVAMGQSGADRIHRDFDWDRKAIEIERVYAGALTVSNPA